MPVTIKCQKCGAENRLGQLFCRECGAKLDLSKLTPEEVARNNRPGFGISSVVRLIRLVVFLALLSVLGLLCWPATPAGDAPSAQGAAVVQGKMAALRGAILRKNDVRETFVEADINAHLNTVLASRGGGGALELQLREVRIDLRAGEATAWTRSSLGPLTITYTAESRFTRGEDGRFDFTSGAVRIGRMPLPGPLRPKITGQLASLFLLLQDETLLLQRLAVVESTDGALQVATVPAAP